MERSYALRMAAAAAVVFTALLASGASSHAEGANPSKQKVHRAPKQTGPLAWCAEEFETLPNGLCHINGGQKDGRRTLVIFLHGMIARDVDWQWLQERALSRQAKQSKFEAIFARAPLSPGGYVWPGTVTSQETSEQDLIDGWNTARAFLEKRNEKPYDDVFLMGFSSGAYFVSALALRGRVKFDGYAVFAGGAGGLVAGGGDQKIEKSPVYVGVCADDAQTANHSRSFGGVLAARGWPSRVDEQRVGHMFSDIHVAHAITYLRNARKPRE
jgi:predicted esterase